MPATIVRRFLDIFPELRTPVAKVCDLNDASATSLWIAMIAHQHQRLQSPTQRRVFVLDNFYTRHSMAQKIAAHDEWRNSGYRHNANELC